MAALGLTLVAAAGVAPAATAAEEAAPDQGTAAPRVRITVALEAENRAPIDLGEIVIELYPESAPRHVANFLKLVDEGFYSGTTFHRLVPGFIIQGGDPGSRHDWKSPRLGTGGPDYTLAPEPGRKHLRGAVAAARQDDEERNPEKESNGSQFFICLNDLPALDAAGYTVFGQVVEGMDVVDKIARVRNGGPRADNRALQPISMKAVTRVEP